MSRTGRVPSLGSVAKVLRKLGIGCRARGEVGAAAVEYAIVAALIAGVIVVAVGVLGTQVVALFQRAVDALPGA